MNFWDERYRTAEGYVFGTAPNDFLAAHAASIPPGPVLCLAEGEGRNAVHLAQRGHAVTAVDQSTVGLAKARALAAQNGMSITTTAADLADYRIEPGAWSGIVAIFAHLPVPLRRKVNAQIVAGLRPGGVYLTEVYAPAQLAFGTGGPKDLALLVPLKDLCAELAGLDLVIARECERDVIEGAGHTGRAAVVQVLAIRRA
ncbi:MAG: class I SAM-dependent methyltransferase [Opitutaceae bacterium]|nr:class I SAM-dependent methyltransferase [Opitutaceae bacterium]